MIVAGESSGDLHAAKFIKMLPEFDFFGIGGEKMQAAGMSLNYHYSAVNVMGFVEVLRYYPKLLKILNELKSEMELKRPKLLILVDFPGFNLKLSKYAHQLGIKVLYFIAPKIWASRYNRIKKIKKYVDHMAVIFPFEVDIYRNEKISVSYVGNPLTKVINFSSTRDEARRELSLNKKFVIGLFPGSRPSEITNILPKQVLIAEKLLREHGDMEFILPLLPHLDIEQVEKILKPISANITIVSDSYLAARASNLVIAASGTLTLELAFLGVLQIVVYQMSSLSFKIAKIIVKLKNVSLVNIVAEKTVVSEFLQNDFNVVNVESEVVKILFNIDLQNKILSDYAVVKNKFGNIDTADRMKHLIMDMVA